MQENASGKLYVWVVTQPCLTINFISVFYLMFYLLKPFCGFQLSGFHLFQLGFLFHLDMQAGYVLYGSVEKIEKPLCPMRSQNMNYVVKHASPSEKLLHIRHWNLCLPLAILPSCLGPKTVLLFHCQQSWWNSLKEGRKLIHDTHLKNWHVLKHREKDNFIEHYTQHR